MSNSGIICIIPARIGSTRLPEKLLQEVNGVPIIIWTYRQAVESGAFDNVYVATDSQRIFSVVQKQGGIPIMTALDIRSGTDRVFAACQSVEGDFIVNLQGDEPLVPAELLRDFAMELTTVDSNTLLTIVSDATIEEANRPHVVKVVLNVHGNALYFSRSPIPYIRDGSETKLYKHIGIYGFSRGSLQRFCQLPQGMLEKSESLEQLRALEHGMNIRCLVRDYMGRGIDTQEDLDAFRKLVGRK